MSELEFMDQQRPGHPVQQLCRVLGVVPCRYYTWRLAQAVGAAGKAEPAWETEMTAVFDHHKRRYGTRRLQSCGKRATGWACARACAGTGASSTPTTGP